MPRRRKSSVNQKGLNEFFKSARTYRGMPMVRTTDGYLVPWDKNMIVEQLHKETQLAKTIFNLEPINGGYAEKIADEVERRVRLSKPKSVSGPMIREMVNNVLMEWAEEKPEFSIYRNLLSRVGAPVYDAYQIDTGNGFEEKKTPIYNLIQKRSIRKKLTDSVRKSICY